MRGTYATKGLGGIPWSQWLRTKRQGLWAQTPQAYSALCPTDSKGWQAALHALSLPQLSGALEDQVREMGESRGPESPPALKVIHSCALEPSRLRSSNSLPPFLGRVLCLVTQSLEKLQVLNGKENWREP